MPDRHPATLALLRWFEYDHLPPHLQDTSRLYYFLAHELTGARGLPDGPELTTALRKLLESKDCAVRATLEAQDA